MTTIRNSNKKRKKKKEKELEEEEPDEEEPDDEDPPFEPAAPLRLEAGPSAAPRLRDMPSLGMGVKGRVAAIEKKKDGVIPMDEDNE